MNSIPFLDLQAVNDRLEPQLTEAVGQVVRSGWYLHGERTRAFEESFAAYCGVRHCVGVGNGLDALILVLTALKQLEGWEEGSEVILPDLTFMATALAVNRAGLKPVFCDVSPTDYLLAPENVEAAITSRTCAILPVHLYGKMCDMTALGNLASRRHLSLVEDAAQAHGAQWQGKKAGACGVAAAYSFYPGKNLGALGDGGAVVTDSDDLAERVRVLANYGAPRKYHHEFLGLNSRLDEVQAAVLGVKLPHLDADNRKRRSVAEIYGNRIRTGKVTLPYDGDTRSSVFHIYPLLATDREGLAAHLARHGIQTLCHYPLPLHRQRAYSSHADERFPVAEHVAAHELSLPVSPSMSEEQALYVADKINEW